jgi:hypothetical protein
VRPRLGLAAGIVGSCSGPETEAEAVMPKGDGDMSFTGVKVFSATKAKDREELGEHVTRWIRDNPEAAIVDKIVTQSSDREFHCLTITLFYQKNGVAHHAV